MIEVFRQARNEKGQMITYWEDIDSGNQCDFEGHIEIGFESEDGNMSDTSPVVPAIVCIKAKNVREAYKRFEREAIKVLEKAKAEINKPKIEVPSAGVTQVINASKGGTGRGLRIV